MKKTVLSKVSQNYLDEFDEAAQSWGWQNDMGIGSAVDRTAEIYNEAKAALVNRIRYLERKAAKK